MDEREREREIAIRAKYLSVSEVKISNPNSLIKCSEKGEGGEGRKKLVRFRVLTRFFTRCLHFIGKASRFSLPPPLPLPSFPRFQFNRNTRRAQPGINGGDLNAIVRISGVYLWRDMEGKTGFRTSFHTDFFQRKNRPNRLYLINNNFELTIEKKIA